jgi:predicted amidohydrolase
MEKGKQRRKRMSLIVKIGILQQHIQSSNFGIKNRKINMDNIEENIKSLLNNCDDIDVLVLPEEFYTGGSYNFTSIPENFYKNKGILRLCDIAKKYHCYIIGGVTSQLNSDDDDKRYKNVGFIIGRDGSITGLQERIHLFEQESKYIIRGQDNRIFDLDFGRVGLALGIDIFDINIIDKLVSEGVRIIFSPSLIPNLHEDMKYNKMFLEKWKNISIARAMETNTFIIGVNGSGNATYTEGFFGGNSFAAGPSGVIKEFGASAEQDILEIDLEEIELVKDFLASVM